MERKTILIFGRDGQVGSALVQRLKNDHNVTALDHDTHSFTDPCRVVNKVLELSPDVIINAAAYTAVDKAENDFEKASLINTSTPVALGAAAYSIGAQFIHYSTDYVFSGAKKEPYLESDQVCPINVYGVTKAAADVALNAAKKNEYFGQMAHFLILRTSWVYDNKGANFLNKMLELAAREDLTEFKVVSDQIGNPTPSHLIADITIKCLEQELALKKPGVYNLTTKGNTSWYEFAKKIFELSGIKKEIKPISTEEYRTPAKRPLNSVLCCTRLEAVIGATFPRWDLALEQYLTAQSP